MPERVGVRELRQNLSRYLDRVKEGEELVVTEHRREIARLVPFSSEAYAELSAKMGATTPTGRIEQVVERLRLPGAPAGTTDAFLAESRGERGR
jgi:prevent-host-death family protein